MATLSTIQRELIRLCLVYPNPPRGTDELRELAKIWHQDIDMTDADLLAAIQDHRRSSPWFPTVHDVIVAHRERCKKRTRETQLLPEDTGPRGITEEEAARNRARVRELLRGLG